MTLLGSSQNSESFLPLSREGMYAFSKASVLLQSQLAKTGLAHSCFRYER